MKKTKLFITLAVIAAAVVAVCIIIYKKNTSGGKLEFVPVSQMADSYYGDTNTMQGNVSDGGVQYVLLREGLVKEVNVSAGDEVKKGDILMSYDQTSYQLAIQSDEADIEVIKSRIQSKNAEIAKYRNLQPAENAPQPSEQIVDHGPLKVLDTCSAADISSEEINIRESTEILPELLMSLRESGETFYANVYKENTKYGILVIDGAFLPEFVYDYIEAEVPDPEPEYQETEGDEPPKEDPEPDPDILYRRVKTDPLQKVFTASDMLLIDDEMMTVKLIGIPFAGLSFVPCFPEEYERYETIYIYPEFDGENYMYSAADLARMVSEGIKEANSLALDLREAEIRLAQDKLIGSSGNVEASIDGVVSEVNPVSETAVGGKLITVSGEASYTVTAYLDEMSLADVKPGDMMSVMCYESGNMVTAVVDHIEDTPGDYYSYGMKNPNNSYYPVIGIVEDKDAVLRVGEWCEVTLMTDTQDSGSFYIPKMYVRNDSDGSYVIKQDEAGKGVKQHVKTGKILWGYEIEIKSGLSKDDSIAFPYGKKVR